MAEDPMAEDPMAEDPMAEDPMADAIGGPAAPARPAAREPADWGLTEEQAELLLELRERSSGWLRSRDVDCVRRHRILDAAVDRLWKRLRQGRPPGCPRAWFQRCVGNLWRSSRYQPRHPPTLSLESLIDAVPLARTGSAPGDPPREHVLATWLREHAATIHGLLSHRQIRIFESCLEGRSSRSAAADLGEQPANFTRAVEQVGRRISEGIRSGIVPPPPSRTVGPPPASYCTLATTTDTFPIHIRPPAIY
jgi:DNA-directed RNA polymerase specialized sigma24 family protein